MKLAQLLSGVEIIECCCDLEIDVSDVVYDSKKVTKGCLFVCLCGFNFDAHEFASQAFENGAAAIICSKRMVVSNFVRVLDTRSALSIISVNFFGNPSEKLKMIAVTGTKGKTTVTGLINKILNDAGRKSASIGTFGVVMGDKIIRTKNTTPESFEIQKVLRMLLDQGFTHVVMEASSLGIKNHRLDGIFFDYAVFTNFSKDHIGKNEHSSIEEYFNSKLLLFGNSKKSFLNCDDEKFEQIAKACGKNYETFGLCPKAKIRAKNVNLVSGQGYVGIELCVGETKFRLPIPGVFNVYNALAAICVCRNEGVDESVINNSLLEAKIKGRAEIVPVCNTYTIMIDYAHNALSMKNILTELRKYDPKRLIILFGAGGERARDRRFEMGKIAGELSDFSVLTADNSRGENVNDIIRDIEIGIGPTGGNYVVIPDRYEAIKYCMRNAKEGDMIVLAGKGHEDYQEISGIKHHFDEREIIKEISALGIHMAGVTQL
ncbi:MAG: UDP-N-acetylmuramoyl-L-alanyl-D-glutamate--2,6-diaminopimelate ligase [Oscillospiraceae bacterium]|nr:UDP-N-acetylmuramoyl-L-alanyl-D-glutamate--2,6-diaminopimelate ligase [Oscillospiraceae bacterium]